MDLYLMRHGIAVPRSTEEPDRDRPLTPKGIRRMRKAAKGLRALKISVDRILTSPLLRARQTAEIVAGVLQLEDRVEVLDELAAESSVKTLLGSLTAYQEMSALLLVGHEPLLGDTASHLLSGSKGVDVELKKGGLCCLEVASPPGGKAILQYLLTPKQLRLMA